VRALKLWCLLVIVLSSGIVMLAECRAYDRSVYARYTDGGDALVDATADARGGAMDALDESTCPAGLSMCNGLCIDLTSSPQNCGVCGHACPGTTCSGSQCTNVCVFARLNCDGNTVNGCETSAATDSMHCGSCMNACAGGQICNAGICQSASMPGGPCVSASDCPAGGLCLTQAMGYPGGYCSGPCSSCPSGSMCTSDYPFCLAPCPATGACRSGYVCATTSQGAFCVPSCADGAVRAAGVCGAGSCTPTGACTSECTVDTECASGHCQSGHCVCALGAGCGGNHTCFGTSCGCANDGACPAGQHCTVATGVCS
jgi:hypothetical protein